MISAYDTVLTSSFSYILIQLKIEIENIENMSNRQRLDQRAENSQRLPMNFNTERKSFLRGELQL